MNFFDGEVGTYSGWVNRLKAYAQQPDGTLKVADVRADNKCPLGHWIYGDGARLGALVEEYTVLKTVHAQFHEAAAEAVALADAGRAEEAQTKLEGKDFKVLFAHLIKAIVLIKQKAG